MRMRRAIAAESAILHSVSYNLTVVVYEHKRLELTPLTYAKRTEKTWKISLKLSRDVILSQPLWYFRRSSIFPDGIAGYKRQHAYLWIELRRLPSLTLTEIENGVSTAVTMKARAAKGAAVLHLGQLHTGWWKAVLYMTLFVGWFDEECGAIQWMFDGANWFAYVIAQSDIRYPTKINASLPLSGINTLVNSSLDEILYIRRYLPLRSSSLQFAHVITWEYMQSEINFPVNSALNELLGLGSPPSNRKNENPSHFNPLPPSILHDS